MNTPTPLKTEVEAAIDSRFKKAEAWLGSNWYPYGIGFASCATLVIVLHWLKLL